MIKSIDECMTNDKYFPDDEDLINGVKDGDYFISVDSSYLNGFINHVVILGGFMIRKRKELKIHLASDSSCISWEEACINVDKLSEIFHTDVSDRSRFDDILILGKSGNSYVFFWKHEDNACCAIGRFPASEYESDKDALFGMEEYAIQLCSAGRGSLFRTMTDKNTYIKYIPARVFTGWITL